MIYSVESPFDVLDELLVLTKKTWDEVDQRDGKIKYEPDLDAYQKLHDAGMLRLYTIRKEEDRKMIGYVIFLVQPALHCKGTFQAVSDVMYIEPEHRGLGTTLLTLAQEDMKQEGVKWFTWTVKAGTDNGKLAERIGCEHYENVYQRIL